MQRSAALGIGTIQIYSKREAEMMLRKERVLTEVYTYLHIVNKYFNMLMLIIIGFVFVDCVCWCSRKVAMWIFAPSFCSFLVFVMSIGVEAFHERLHYAVAGITVGEFMRITISGAIQFIVNADLAFFIMVLCVGQYLDRIGRLLLLFLAACRIYISNRLIFY